MNLSKYDRYGAMIRRTVKATSATVQPVLYWQTIGIEGRGIPDHKKTGLWLMILSKQSAYDGATVSWCFGVKVLRCLMSSSLSVGLY